MGANQVTDHYELFFKGRGIKNYHTSEPAAYLLVSLFIVIFDAAITIDTYHLATFSKDN